MRLTFAVVVATALGPLVCSGLQLSNLPNKKNADISNLPLQQHEALSRRQAFSKTFRAASALMVGSGILLGLPQASQAYTVTGPDDLSDLPPEAIRSYLQYRGPLQTSTDFYIFELQELLDDPSSWGQIGELFQANNNRGQGIPSRIEREFTNTMRIVGLSMPPDTAEEMRDAQYAFDRAMGKISKATAGIRRDLPVEIDKNAVPKAKEGWEEGRVALNSFLTSLNGATGLSEMKVVPAAGPNQFKEYGRSERRYLDLKKKIKLCQNRGGPTLSQAWGQLMVSGYMQDSCGIPDLEAYFYQ